MSKKPDYDEPIPFSYLYVMVAGFLCIFMGCYCCKERPIGYGYHLVRYQIVSYPTPPAPTYSYYGKQQPTVDKTEWAHVRTMLVEGNGVIEEDVKSRITRDSKDLDEAQKKMLYIVVINSMQELTKDQYNALDSAGVPKMTVYRK